MNWERSEGYEDWPGCRGCVHYQHARCRAYPDRIPLLILSGEVDHLVPRPGQVGDTVFEPMDMEIWRRTRERVPLRKGKITERLA
jgi:hypothetical protein